MNFLVSESQKCLIYDINLNKIAYNNLVNVDSICSNINNNNNSFCEVTLSSCFCKKNYYGENCEKKIDEVKIISGGISNSHFNILVVILILIFPSILIIGLFMIFFLCKNNPNNIKIHKIKTPYAKRKKISNINIENNENRNVIITNDIEKKINQGDHRDNNNIDFTQLRTDNTNIMFKRELNTVSNFNENNITDNDDKFKYSQIPLSTERKDDNMLITLRNNTEIDNDSSVYKRTGINNLNTITIEEYAKKFDEIEEFIYQFKSSLQENFYENENFMNFIEDIFINAEKYMNERDNHNTNKSCIKKIKTEFQKLFNKLSDNVLNGKNYLRANNFYLRYQQIFSINDETNIIEEDNSHANYEIKKKDNSDISFDHDISGAYYKENNINLNKNNLELPDSSRKNLNAETSYLPADKSNNEFLENKIKTPKKIFAIKSVEISKSPIRTKKNEKNQESSRDRNNQHNRKESKQSNSNKKEIK